jgi:predicted DNA-binding protein with PD1-like motif
MEIVSLVGTLSSVGGHHLHMSLSGKNRLKTMLR